MKKEMASQKQRVLFLFRKILRLGRTWEAMSGKREDTLTERAYIASEASKLFRQNKDIKNAAEIEEHIKEGEIRLELALHYRIPYPRQLYLQQSSLPPREDGIRGFKASQKRSAKQSRPIYLKSYTEKDSDK